MMNPARARLLEYYTDWVNANSRSECAALLRKWPCNTPPEFQEIEKQFLLLETRFARDSALLGPFTPVKDDARRPDVPPDPWAHLLREPITPDEISRHWTWISALKAADAEVKRLRGVILQGAVDEMNKRKAAREAEASVAPVVSALTDEEREAVQKHLQNWRYFAVNESLAHLIEIVVDKLWGIR